HMVELRGAVSAAEDVDLPADRDGGCVVLGARETAQQALPRTGVRGDGVARGVDRSQAAGEDDARADGRGRRILDGRRERRQRLLGEDEWPRPCVVAWPR